MVDDQVITDPFSDMSPPVCQVVRPSMLHGLLLGMVAGAAPVIALRQVASFAPLTAQTVAIAATVIAIALLWGTRSHDPRRPPNAMRLYYALVLALGLGASYTFTGAILVLGQENGYQGLATLAVLALATGPSTFIGARVLTRNLDGMRPVSGAPFFVGVAIAPLCYLSIGVPLAGAAVSAFVVVALGTIPFIRLISKSLWSILSVVTLLTVVYFFGVHLTERLVAGESPIATYTLSTGEGGNVVWANNRALTPMPTDPALDILAFSGAADGGVVVWVNAYAAMSPYASAVPSKDVYLESDRMSVEALVRGAGYPFNAEGVRFDALPAVFTELVEPVDAVVMQERESDRHADHLQIFRTALSGLEPGGRLIVFRRQASGLDYSHLARSLGSLASACRVVSYAGASADRMLVCRKASAEHQLNSAGGTTPDGGDNG